MPNPPTSPSNATRAPATWSASVLEERRIRPIDPGDAQAPTALVWHAANALDADTWAMPDPYGLLPGAGLIVRSGWRTGDGEERPLWLAPSRGLLEQFAEHVEAQAASAGLTPVMLATAGDVLSDVPSLMLFLRSRAAQGWRMLMAPTLLLTPGMLERSEEHLERIVEQCAGHEALWGWLACEPDFREGGTFPQPLRAGSRLSTVLARVLSRQGMRRVVLLGQDRDALQAQRELLLGANPPARAL